MTFKKLIFPAVIMLFAFAETARAQAKAPSNVKERIAQVENNLIAWVKLDSNRNWNIYDRMKTLRIQGLTIAVIDNYKIDWVKAYGWADTLERQPVTNETLFQSASIGKSVNGFAFMKLHQDKKVDFSEDINSYLHSWTFPYDTVSKGKHIDLRSILSHTAGLSVHGFDGYKWNEPLPDLKQIIEGRKPANNEAVRSERAAGVIFQYSGGGYEISELLLQDVTHQSYEAFVSQAIFKPLRMTNSTYQLRPAAPRATAYRYDGKDIGCKYHVYPEKACGAGLWTTATDLAKFVIAIQSALSGKSKVLTTASATLMLTPPLASSNCAMGFFIEQRGGEKYFQHGGLNEGFCSQYYGSFEQGRGVVVLVNSDYTPFPREVVNSVATVYGWKDFYPYVSKRIVRPSDEVLSRYVGQYKFEGSEEGPSISKRDGNLYLQDPHSTVPWKIYFTSDKEFFMLEAQWANQEFFFDTDGIMKGFYILGDNYKGIVRKAD